MSINKKRHPDLDELTGRIDEVDGKKVEIGDSIGVSPEEARQIRKLYEKYCETTDNPLPLEEFIVKALSGMMGDRWPT